MAKIEAGREALDKINRGEYGIGSTCNASIPEARLDATPFTKFRVPCMSEVENEPENPMDHSDE